MSKEIKWIFFFFNIFIILNKSFSLKLAKPCLPSACKLPKCKCSTTSSDSSIPISKIPQMVMLSFDDATTVVTHGLFNSTLFGRKNPDGCAIGATHFLSHEYTDYTLVNDLWLRGHEIALHSVTHSTAENYWKNINLTTVKSEFDDMRQMAINLALIPKNEIRGGRLPFLQTSGNVSFQGLQELGLVYDSSLPALHFDDDTFWPYTLEYRSKQECMIPDCPTASFPNFWEIPMVMWLDEKNIPCSMVDACIYVPQKAIQVSKWIIKQFLRHYNTTRSPFPVFMHAAWFLRNPENVKGFQMFIDYIQKLPDVYLVTANQVINWIKNPKSLDNKKPFGDCEVRKPEVECKPRSCQYKLANGDDRWIKTCTGKCTNNYPWLHNPLGI